MTTPSSRIKHLRLGIFALLASTFAPSSLLHGQAVTFAGAQTFLPAAVSGAPIGIAVDSAGDVFIGYNGSNSIVKLPATATGYGPQSVLPITGLQGPWGIAVDSTGDVFVIGYYTHNLIELPKTATGYGRQVTVPITLKGPFGIALDSAGNIFVADANAGDVVELPKTATGFGTQITLPFSGLEQPWGIAVDAGGDVFVADYGNDDVVDLPKTASGYGAQITVPFVREVPFAMTLDSGGDLFVTQADIPNVAELPKAANGFGEEITLPFSGLLTPFGVAVDKAGDILVADNNNQLVFDLQTRAVKFGSVNVCATPSLCNETVTLNYQVTAGGTLGTPKVLTNGQPNLDFTLASGSTCTGTLAAGASCKVNVNFTPEATGARNGSVEITDGSGKVLATTPISGFGQQVAVDFTQGFAQSQGTLQLNGNSAISGNALELTDGGLNEVSSAFTVAPVNVQSFTTDFAFQLTNPRADGFTFTIQNSAAGVVGAHGGDLGYAGIDKSVAIKFDLYQNPGDPSNNSTGLFVDGARPIGYSSSAANSSIDLNGTGINLHSGDLIKAHIAYAGTGLYLTLTDTVTSKTWSVALTVDIPKTVGGNTAYVGFTASSGGLSAVQRIVNWQFASTK